MTKVRGTGESIQMDEDWFVRRDGSMFPVSYTSTPIDMPDGPGVVVAFKDIEEQRGGRAGAARARGDPRDGRPAGLGHRPGGPLPLRQSGRARRARLRGALRPRGPARPRPRPLQVPRRHAVPRGRLPAGPARAGRGRRCRTPTTGSCARTARSCASPTPRRRSSCPTAAARSPRSATSRSSAAPSRRRASATSPRRARPSCASRGGASSRRRTRRAPSSSATCTTARSSSSSAPCCSCGWPSARRPSDPDRARELREQAIELASGGIDELRRLAAGIHPAILTDRGLGPAVQAPRLPAAARGLRGARRPTSRLPAPVEASVYFFVSEALTNVVKHARAREATVSMAADDGGLTVEVGDDGVGGAQVAAAAGCAAWATASAPSTGRSRSRARPAAGRCCARGSR